MIFQNAMSALNPVFRVGDQIVDAIRHHTGATRDGGAGACGERSSSSSDCLARGCVATRTNSRVA